MSTFDERYRAIASRDRRFDGQFYTAVRTTGIYCRPSCPARTPRPENVTFYETSAAAHEAGYRACKRCLPEAVPGTPAWDARHDLAARAMRLVRDGVVDREGVDGLAARLGYSARHLHRVLTAELGAGPVALARAVRAQTARTLVVGTGLPLAEVAFASGFGSIRQFNDTVVEIFGSTPSALRQRTCGTMPDEGATRQGTMPRPRGARLRAPAGVSAVGAASAARAVPGGIGGDLAAASAATLIELALPYREPFDAAGIFAFLAARAVPGVERVPVPDPGRPAPTPLVYARTVALPHGPGAFEATFADRRLTVRLELTSTADLAAAIARIRHLFDLDADPVAVDSTLAADPVLGPLAAQTPGARLPGSTDAHEIVTRTVVGQQISVSAARTHLARLATLGTPYASRLGVDRLFPTAQQIADGGRDLLRGPARRTEALLAVARALAEGTVDVSPATDRDALREALLAQPGVGPWSVGYVAMRVLHDPDVLLVSDGALLTGARRLGLVEVQSAVEVQRRSLEARGAAWAPWRSYASLHLWRAAGRPATGPAPPVSRTRGYHRPRPPVPDPTG